VARGTRAELLEWKTIEVHELSKRPNSKIIVLGDKRAERPFLSEKQCRSAGRLWADGSRAADELEGLDRLMEPFDGEVAHRPQAEAIAGPGLRGRVSRVEPGWASCSMRAATCVVFPTAVTSRPRSVSSARRRASPELRTTR
jgi:hypothetical protein